MTGFRLFLLSTVATPAEVIAQVLKNQRRDDVDNRRRVYSGVFGPPPITGVWKQPWTKAPLSTAS
jgi:hypothetical protein